ncbi:MAG: DNA alkylation repair protein [Nanoarchaeota archaeon]
MLLVELKKELINKANPERAKPLQRFFKTGKGEYAEGDIFLGISVPESRKLALKCNNLPFQDIKILLSSKIHEERLIALLILINNYAKADKNLNTKTKREIFEFYLKNTKHINNWDLVDLSAHKIVGNYLADKDKSILYNLASSDNLWERRIAILSTFNFIRDKQFNEVLKIAKMLLNDKHDLMHKAVGWMLREVGKRDKEVLDEFLKKHCKKMPRTMLRYSIERFPEEGRKEYLFG